jgi:hypothetical protein
MAFFGLFAVAGFAIWIWALVDALRRPTSDWEGARQNQIVWVLVIVLTNLIGAVIYLLVARPQLDRASRT